MQEKTIKVFCAHEQKETDHTLQLDQVGEIVLTCVSNIGTENEPKACGRFLKYPKGTKPSELLALLEKHMKLNEGQVSTDSLEEASAKFMDELLGEE